MRILFLTKAERRCREALAFLRERADVESYEGDWGEAFPAPDWQGDVIISYLSRWIVPAHIIKRADLAINFHPAPPEYPGIGCFNWALYEGARTYGATCHAMVARVDWGPIIAVRRFDIAAGETVASLIERAYDVQLGLFREIMTPMLAGWSGQRRSRAALDALAVATDDMPDDEIERRRRAVTFGRWGVARAH